MLNLTGHDILLIDANGGLRTPLPAAWRVAWVSTTEKVVDFVKINSVAIPVVTRIFGQFKNLPDTDQPCLVPKEVLEACRILQPWRRHIYAPNLSTAARDEGGRIVVREFII